ncbi:MAG: hypothetical protein RQM92_04295 [Candidatus Syntrophopropionicum ammoniitolerans]
MRKNNILLVVVSLVTVVFWLLLKPVEPITSAVHISQLVGPVPCRAGLCEFHCHHRDPGDRLFGGLDKAYVDHKWVSLIAIVLIIVHIGILAGGEGLIIARELLTPRMARGCSVGSALCYFWCWDILPSGPPR